MNAPLPPAPNLRLVGSSPRGVGNADGFGLPPLPQQPTVGGPQGTSYAWNDRLFLGIDLKEAVDYNDWQARDLENMFGRDYRARQIENVQALPILGATKTWQAAPGDKGEMEFIKAFFDADPLNDGPVTPLDMIEAQMTTAFGYRKAYWELCWAQGTGQFAGKVVPKEIGFRPQTTVRTRRDPQSGAELGFEQEPLYIGPGVRLGTYPIKIDRSKGRSWIYVHGARRDPINGVSDFDVIYWAWRTKQKIMLLWFSFLEGVALPRQAVFARENANEIASKLALARNSAVIGIDTPDATQVNVQTMDLSGKGADQFLAAIKWLDGCASGSVLAGFLDLTSNAAQGGGPVGVHLSSDASDFFLQTLEHKTVEMQYNERINLFAPMAYYNFGPNAAVPTRKYEPLQAEDKTAAVEMLTMLLRSRDPALVPDDFIGQLASMVADYMGMDGSEVEKAFMKAAADAKAQAAQMQSQMGNPAGPGGNIAATNAVVGRAQQLVSTRQQGGTRIPGINAPTLPTNY